MRIGRVRGLVTLSKCHPSFDGARLRIALPLSWDALLGDAQDADETLVVWDELNAGDRSLIAISEGREAARPFYPDVKPVDAYNAALIDSLDLPTDES